MSDINQIKNSIKEEIEKSMPSPSKILSHLLSFRFYEEGLEYAPEDEWRYISDAEFFDIFGDTFKANPEFYMKNLYKDVKKKLPKDMRKRMGISLMDLKKLAKENKEISFLGKLAEMDKYIFEKYCLYDGEKILFESGGIIKWGKVQGMGNLWFTNYRIVSQGFIMPVGGEFSTGLSDRKRIINYSRQQKCYGYIFPIKNLTKLKKRNNGVSYKAKQNNYSRKVRIIIAKFPNREEHFNKIFEILSKHSEEEIKYH